jgi:hypothetical protein
MALQRAIKRSACSSVSINVFKVRVVGDANFQRYPIFGHDEVTIEPNTRRFYVSFVCCFPS